MPELHDQEARALIKTARHRMRLHVRSRLSEMDKEKRQEHAQLGALPCEACQMYAGITEMHHIFSFKDLVDFMVIIEGVRPGLAYRFQFSYSVTWLCPTCHAIIHLLQSKSSESLNKLRALMEESEHTQWCIERLRNVCRRRVRDIRYNRQKANYLFKESGIDTFRFSGDDFSEDANYMLL